MDGAAVGGVSTTVTAATTPITATMVTTVTLLMKMTLVTDMKTDMNIRDITIKDYDYIIS